MKQQGVKNGGTSGKNGGEIKFHKEWGCYENKATLGQKA